MKDKIAREVGGAEWGEGITIYTGHQPLIHTSNILSLVTSTFLTAAALFLHESESIGILYNCILFRGIPKRLLHDLTGIRYLKVPHPPPQVWSLQINCPLYRFVTHLKSIGFCHSRLLQGLDNIAADGAAGFQTMERIVDDLKEKGSVREWCIQAQRRLQEGKRYLKTDYRVHCTEDSSPCKDHCRKFALSDPVEEDFKEECDHGHHLRCYMCEDLKDVMNDIKQQILESSASMYSKEYQEDLLYDFEQAKTDIFQWKAHILRSVNQDKAKQDVIRNLNDSSALVVMDWAMKFLQLKYREKQSDWFAKRGISWHISTVIFKQDASSKVEVQTYAHLFDYCQQDWFAVCSIFENLLKNILASKPLINSVFLRSDEAGCYHNNALIASLKDVGMRLGVKVKRYDYSELAYGKDVCDQIFCPMKSSIRCYCDKGHDINCAANMRTALLERPV